MVCIYSFFYIFQPVKSEPPHQSSPAVEPIDMTKQEKEKLERKQMRNRIAALVHYFLVILQILTLNNAANK